MITNATIETKFKYKKFDKTGNIDIKLLSTKCRNHFETKKKRVTITKQQTFGGVNFSNKRSCLVHFSLFIKNTQDEESLMIATPFFFCLKVISAFC